MASSNGALAELHNRRSKVTRTEDAMMERRDGRRWPGGELIGVGGGGSKVRFESLAARMKRLRMRI